MTDRAALHRNRARASETFLHAAARDELQDRLELVNRQFTSPAVVTPFPDVWQAGLPGARIVPDDDTLDLMEGAHDLVLHALCLHWANDPVGQIIQCRRALRPDGLLLAIALGGETLHELRISLAQAEAEVTGGLSPRIAPMAEVRDWGSLLQRGGLALPVADSAPLKVTYQSPLHLMHDLRAMGEGNALAARLRKPTRRQILHRAGEIYQAAHATPEGRIAATFEMVTLTGWAPADSQPKPLRPGSAARRLADALNTDETPLPRDD